MMVLFLFMMLSCLQTCSCDDEISTEQLLEEAHLYCEQQEYHKAIDRYRKVLVRTPSDLQHIFRLAYCYTAIGAVDHALVLNDTILRHIPDCVSVLHNSGYLYKMKDNPEAAITCYKKALAIEPNRDETYFGLGMAYLIAGDFENGWHVHERYLKRVGRNADQLRAALREGTIAGKKILLRPEGGLGDTIQFFRYAKALKKLGAYVITYLPKELYPLLSRSPFVDEVLTVGSAITPDIFDHTTLMSMPAIWYAQYKELVTDLDYITPDPARSAHWHEVLAQDTNYKIGICWGASIYNDSSRHPVARRSIPLSALYPLHDIPGVSLYSLQRFDGEEQLQDVPDIIKIKTFGPDFDVSAGPFMDTAAILPELDLVICVDSATAHLAGVLCKKVFLLLPYSTDWRWIARRTDSPWYPNMRLFKQEKPFDWTSVVQSVCDAVQKAMEKNDTLF